MENVCAAADTAYDVLCRYAMASKLAITSTQCSKGYTDLAFQKCKADTQRWFSKEAEEGRRAVG